MSTENRTHGKSIIPTYVPDNLWGNTFVQHLTVGFASYHFLEDGKTSYISYEHEKAKSLLPKLDNGSPLPLQMNFTETSFDANERIFRGKIDWETTHGTTIYNGMRYWRYEIHFSKDYTCIEGGNVTTVGTTANISSPAPIASQQPAVSPGEETVFTIFGQQLVYINAGYVEKMKPNTAEGYAEFSTEVTKVMNTVGQSLFPRMYSSNNNTTTTTKENKKGSWKKKLFPWLALKDQIDIFEKTAGDMVGMVVMTRLAAAFESSAVIPIGYPSVRTEG